MHTYSNLGTQPFSRNAFTKKASLALGVFALLSTTFMVQTASAQINHTSNPQQRLPGGSKSDRSSSGYKRVQRPTARSTSSHRTTSHGSSSRDSSSRGTSTRGTSTHRSSHGTTSSRHSDRSTRRREHRREDTTHRREDTTHRRSDRSHRRETNHHNSSSRRNNRHYRHDRNRHNNRHTRNNYRHSNNSFFDFSFNNRYNRRHNRHHTGYYTNYRSQLGINFFFGNTGYSSYRWATSPYSFYRPGQWSYSHYRTNTQCERVIIEGNHQGHAEMISVKECYNPYDGYYIIQGSERIIDCRDTGYRRPTYY